MEIGGYFSLELNPQEHYLHEDGVFVNSGRHALEYVLRTIHRIDCLYIPSYTCRVVKIPLEKLGIKYKRYEIDKDFHISEIVDLGEDDYILYTNYFGIMDSYVLELSKMYGSKLLVDNAQAMYAKPIKGVRTVYSPRKFIGVADGGIAYSPTDLYYEITETDISVERTQYLLSRYDYSSAIGYAASKESNKTIEGTDLKWMSNLTKTIYKSADFEMIKRKRRDNFNYLHEKLCNVNGFTIPSLDSFVCPMIYPFYTKDEGLIQKLIKDGIFIAVYWPYVIQTCSQESVAVDLAKHIVALPIDQRYGSHEMEYIVEHIQKHMEDV